jgi:hypothetical protein
VKRIEIKYGIKEGRRQSYERHKVKGKKKEDDGLRHERNYSH